MQQLDGKTAFVTGGAGGLGLAMAQAFVRQGMKVMIADIDQASVDQAVRELAAGGAQAAGTVCDVSDRAGVEAAAQRTLEAFGKVHVVCNNAGVGVVGPVGTIAPGDWDWILDVNLKGVIHGVEVFLPLIEAHGEGGHFVNTGSMSSLVVRPGREPYAATKFAILALSEGWAMQLEPRGIGVSVLMPGYVQTRIGESKRARQARYGGPSAQVQTEQSGGPSQDALVAGAMTAETVGERVVEAIRANELHIVTHPEMKAVVEARFGRILRAFDRAAASPALARHLAGAVMPEQDRELAQLFDAG
jgi:NAD(P)-dependent dehydrogenase (short-subunit alcohol dehydrogenase family)